MEYLIDLNAGDPTPRKWLLLRSSWEPVSVTLLYVLVSKYVLPWYMKNRKPYQLRNTMLAYNFFLVFSYIALLLWTLNHIRYVPWEKMCIGSVLEENTHEYTLVSIAYWLYLMKYLEFMDTIFFVLRKKMNLLTTLHVTHHALMPILGFILFRTETSGAQAVPIVVNGLVHVVMYSYYFLAAMGPAYAKYLWWKRYLTIMQMIQFIIILTFAVVLIPLSGCRTAKSSIAVDIGAATFFFVLFYNFYQHCFVKPKDTKPGIRCSEKEG